MDKGILIQFQKDSGVFNLGHLHAKSKTSEYLVNKLLFADDSVLYAQGNEDIGQYIISCFSNSCN